MSKTVWERRYSEKERIGLQVYYQYEDHEALLAPFRLDTVDVDFQHSFQWGVNYRHYRDEFDPSELIVLTPDSLSADLFSLFAQDQIALSERWQLTVGARLERNDYTGWEFQPSVRLRWKPDERQRVWAAVSRAVRTPSRVEEDARINMVTTPPGEMVVLGRRWRIRVCRLFLCLTPAGWPLTASTLSADEYAIKAAYLYNFAKCVEWPPKAFATSNNPLLICVIGDNPFGDALTNLRGKRVGHHPVTVPELSTGADAPCCHIVFIARSQQSRLKSLLTTLGSRPVLTVSDIENFTQAGGIIGLTEVEQRIQFVINAAAVRRAGLTLSSQLLKLATMVDDNGGL